LGILTVVWSLAIVAGINLSVSESEDEGLGKTWLKVPISISLQDGGDGVLEESGLYSFKDGTIAW
jgi:hypothetical protein